MNHIDDMTPRALELLAPARDRDTAIEAILHGADAVYMGPEAFGARSKAGNSIDDIKRVVDFATPFGVRVYATVNTIIYDDELDRARRLVWDLYQAGVDALIVQDLGLLQLDLPPIALHASTQCDTRTPAKARFLASCGFTRLVLPREMSTAEIRACAEAASPAAIEAFVHGALCVSYSGDCRASYVNNGRSANRGECAQMCRLPYQLVDGSGNPVGKPRHYLSLRDLNRVSQLGAMAGAGVTSFKIEGRLKDKVYVKNVTAAYRRALDTVIESSNGRYVRASRGDVTLTFEPDLSKSFNRGFTTYFIDGKATGEMASIDTPKSLGQPAGKVMSSKGRNVECRLHVDVNNGDGFTYVAPDGSTGGFRVNRAEGNRLVLADDVTLPRDTRLYRNYDREFETLLAGDTARRLIPVDLHLSVAADSTLVLTGTIDDIGDIVVAEEAEMPQADKPDGGRRSANMAKLGGTQFVAREVVDVVGERFVRASQLSELRRRLVASMTDTLKARFRHEPPGKPSAETAWPENVIVTEHDNIANHLAREFYRAASGCDDAPEALEVAGDDARRQPELRVMTTRYCLRRELGCCLKQNSKKDARCEDSHNPVKRLTGPLYLRGAGFEYRLDFDCAHCRMHVIANPRRR